MGTIIDRLEIARGGWRSRHSALHLAVAAAKSCLHEARRDADALDLLVNAGIYRDSNLGEPALAALIQEDIGAIPRIRTRMGTAHPRSTSPTEPAEYDRTLYRLRIPEIAHDQPCAITASAPIPAAA